MVQPRLTPAAASRKEQNREPQDPVRELTMPGDHHAPTVEMVHPTPALPEDFSREEQRPDGKVGRQPTRRLSFSREHQPQPSPSGETMGGTSSRKNPGAVAGRSKGTHNGSRGATDGAVLPPAASKRHTLAAFPQKSLGHHYRNRNRDGNSDEDTSDQHPGADAERLHTGGDLPGSRGLAPPPPAPGKQAADNMRAHVPRPERGRNRRPQSASPPASWGNSAQKDADYTASPEAESHLQLAHPRRRRQPDENKHKSIMPPNTSSGTSEQLPHVSASSHNRIGSHHGDDTDRSWSPEQPMSPYEQEKAELEAKLKMAQATQNRNMAAAGMGMPGDRLSKSVGGTMPAGGGVAGGSMGGGGYPYPFSLPGQMPPPPHLSRGALPPLQAPPSPHFQPYPPPLVTSQMPPAMGRLPPGYDPRSSAGGVASATLSDPPPFFNPSVSMQPPRRPSFAGAPQRDHPSPELSDRERHYATPEMPRDDAMYLHVRPSASTNTSTNTNMLPPRGPNPAGQAKHPPRSAECLPPTGYELLAMQLANNNRPSRRDSAASAASSSSSTTGAGGAKRLPPLYKRFTLLQHRVLLTLQDELAELEEQLHRLDADDTQMRRAASGGQILPASRRQDAGVTANELQWMRTNLIGRIGEKIGVYSAFFFFCLFLPFLFFFFFYFPLSTAQPPLWTPVPPEEKICRQGGGTRIFMNCK